MYHITIICTHSHMLVDPNVTMTAFSQARTFKTIPLQGHTIVLHGRGYISCYGGLFDQTFHLNIVVLE